MHTKKCRRCSVVCEKIRFASLGSAMLLSFGCLSREMVAHSSNIAPFAVTDVIPVANSYHLCRNDATDLKKPRSSELFLTMPLARVGLSLTAGGASTVPCLSN